MTNKKSVGTLAFRVAWVGIPHDLPSTQGFKQNFEPEMLPRHTLLSDSSKNKRFPVPGLTMPPPDTAEPTKENALNSPLDEVDEDEVDRRDGGEVDDAGDKRLSQAESSTDTDGVDMMDD
jgi:hypothetical protein